MELRSKEIKSNIDKCRLEWLSCICMVADNRLTLQIGQKDKKNNTK